MLISPYLAWLMLILKEADLPVRKTMINKFSHREL
jgi:hypothetical protein